MSQSVLLGFLQIHIGRLRVAPELLTRDNLHPPIILMLQDGFITVDYGMEFIISSHTHFSIIIIISYYYGPDYTDSTLLFNSQS